MSENVGVSEPAGVSEAHARTWRLLLRWRVVVGRVEAEVRAAGGVDLDGLFVLRSLALAREQESRMTINGLAASLHDATGLSRPATSRLIGRLQDAGLVLVREGIALRGQDARTRVVELQRKGMDAYEAAWAAYARGVERHFTRRLPEEIAAVMSAAIEQIMDPTEEPMSPGGDENAP